MRAPWSLPVFASIATLAFVLATAIPSTSSAQATVLAPGGPVTGSQTIVASGERTAYGARGEYTVTKAPVIAVAPAGGIPDPGTAQAIAYEMVMARGWSTGEFDCLVALWNRESHWNVYAENKSSGAYGIPQALPGNKMATAGADWQTNPATQITWGLGYIAGRYSTPCGAWAHSEVKGWY